MAGKEHRSNGNRLARVLKDGNFRDVDCRYSTRIAKVEKAASHSSGIIPSPDPNLIKVIVIHGKCGKQRKARVSDRVATVR
jgi:hypothetical protein